MTETSTRSPAYSLTGSQEPTHLIEPDYLTSEWESCHDINAVGKLNLLEWQDRILKGWLGINEMGRWAAQTCGGSIPRQNGKTLGVVVPRCNYGMIAHGEEIIYTSHLQKTSTETFESIASFFDRKALKKYVKDIKTALGREQVILNNGGRIKFLARTRNGGRGQHGDLLIFDEALELDADSQASFLPAISASSNPQVIYISTPPTAKSDCGVFRDIRKRALSGETDRMAWCEWSVDEIGDVKDRKRWYATNPSLGILIQESTVEAECEQMDADTFARERLGWWSKTLTEQAEHVIDVSDWNACKVDSAPDGLIVYAVKFSPDGSIGTLAKCTKPENGKPFVYVVDARSMSGGLSWFADNLAARKDKAAQIVIDGQSNAQALNDILLDRGVPPKVIKRPNTSDVIASNSALVNAVKTRDVTHYGQPALDDSATKTIRRRIGQNGGFGFASTDDADATLIEACALAYREAMITKRKPGRKAVVF
jgi:hypothetical protein